VAFELDIKIWMLKTKSNATNKEFSKIPKMCAAASLITYIALN
jgi:hypothetical protein